jgi:hypothetical protein
MGAREWGFQIRSRVAAPTVELYLRSLRLRSAFASRSVSISSRERVRHARASDLLVWDAGNVDPDRERKIACVLDDSG